MRTATALIEYSEHLREAVGQALFDFTVIRLVVNWLCEALGSSPTEFGNIKTLLDALASATAITSGHGMREIWSALLPVNVSTEDLRMIKSLATSRYRLNIDGTQESESNSATRFICTLSKPLPPNQPFVSVPIV